MCDKLGLLPAGSEPSSSDEWALSGAVQVELCATAEKTNVDVSDAMDEKKHIERLHC
jgi:hypothetical protein